MFNHDCFPNSCRFEYLDRDGEGRSDIIVCVFYEMEEGYEVCLNYGMLILRLCEVG
jgi:hypothetical protein